MLRFQVLFLLAFLGLAAAQDSTQAVMQASTQPASPVKVGFGVSIGPATVLLAGPSGSYPSEQFLSGFYLPIVGSAFKVEPEFAISRVKATEEAEDYEYELSYMALRLGVGLFKISPIGQTVLYYGGRIGVILESISEDYDSDFAGDSESDDNSRTNFYVGPALGAEHFIGKNFSIGAEGQLIITVFGDYSDEDEFASTAQTHYTAIDNRALVFLRWYY
jgi:hypothetical protein